LSFAAAKIDFDDIRLDGEEWAKEKACEYKTLKLAKFFIGKIAAYKHSFCYSNVPATKTKELFVSTANGSLVGTLISTGDVNDIFAMLFFFFSLLIFFEF